MLAFTVALFTLLRLCDPIATTGGLGVMNSGGLRKFIESSFYSAPADAFATNNNNIGETEEAFIDSSATTTCANSSTWGVITTILEVNAAVIHFISHFSDACLVVVGDYKTNHTLWRDLEIHYNHKVVYLSPRQQQKQLHYQMVKLLPWNHFGRKNVGFLYAISRGADMIYDFDDDNHLSALSFQEAFEGMQVKKVRMPTNHHVLNPYPYLEPTLRKNGSATFVWPRGFPLQFVNDPESFEIDTDTNTTTTWQDLAVVQSLADHDPDVDGIYRMTQQLPVYFAKRNAIIVPPRGTFVPWNAQAAVVRRKAFFGLLLPVTVTGRVTDIWRSYITMRLLWDTQEQIGFSAPIVSQYRNPHSYMKDFEDEYDLYHKVDRLLETLASWTSDGFATLDQAYLDLVSTLVRAKILQRGDLDLATAWVADLARVGYEWPALNPERLQPFVPRIRPVVDQRDMATSIDSISDTGFAARSFKPQCSHVKQLYSESMATTPRKDWNMTQERILVMSTHGGPHSDTVYSLLELGFSSESIYSICKMQFCYLTGIGVRPTGLGDDVWAHKKISGTDPKGIASALRIDDAIHGERDGRLTWARIGHEQTYDKFFRAVLSEYNASVWNGGALQREFDSVVGDAANYFTAVVCPFPSALCAPLLDDKYSSLKVILRLTHRLTHWTDPSTSMGMRAMLKRMAENPSRFLVASNNAFDIAALRSWADGNDWMQKLKVTGYDRIPGVKVLFWPGYYRHVREWSPTEMSSPPVVLGVGHGYRQVTLDKFRAFTKVVNDKKEAHAWKLVEKLPFANISTAALALIFPYSTHSAKVNELYAMSVPMLCPSIKLLVSLGRIPSDVQPHIGMSDEFLTQVAPMQQCHSNASAPPLLQWTAWADAYTHPYIHYFDSFEELPQAIDGLIGNPTRLEETRRLMRKHWDESYKHTSSNVLAALGTLLSSSS